MKHYALEMWTDEQPRQTVSTYLHLSWQVKITGPRRSRLFLQNFNFSLPYVLDNGALTHHEYVQRVLHYSGLNKTRMCFE